MIGEEGFVKTGQVIKIKDIVTELHQEIGVYCLVKLVIYCLRITRIICKNSSATM